MRTFIIFIFAYIFAAFSVFAQVNNGGSISNAPPTITHIPVIHANEGVDIEIEARVNDENLQAIYLYYKSTNEDNFDYIKMYSYGDVYTAIIPAEKVKKIGIEYYLEATDSEGNVVTSPNVNAYENPYRIDITGSFSNEPEITILSPEPNQIINPNDVIIVASFYDPQNNIDINSIRITIDGIDVTREATITTSMLSYVPISPLESGIHKIEIEAKDNVNKTSVHKQCVFVDNSAPEPDKKVGEPKSEWDGSDANYYDISEFCQDNPEQCWKVTLLTPIELECTDLDQPHPVPEKEVCFKVGWDADDVTEEYCDNYVSLQSRSCTYMMFLKDSKICTT